MLVLRLIKESFLFAFHALSSNRLRTMLSLLGISIGIFIIVTVFTVVDSLENNLRGSVEKLGSNIIFVQKWPWVFDNDFPWWKYYQRPSPNIQDYEQLEKRNVNADAITFSINISGQTVKYLDNAVEEVEITASTHSFEKVRALEFEEGRYFSASESRSGRNYALLGHDVAKGLFGNTNPIGKNIKIKGRSVQVIGVVKKEGSDILNNTSDNSVYLSINYVRNLVDIRRDRFDPRIMVKAKSDEELAGMENELKGTLRAIHKLSPREDDDFSLNKSSMLSAQLESLFIFVDIAGWIIGGFSILVGGFGIANIMFVSVKERTNIIGIQKSLGAKNNFILLQFLIESVTLCLIGGLIGLLIVFLLMLAASGILDMDIGLSFGNVVLGLSVSAIIGIISGFWPAYSASQLDPVVAIRSGQ